MTKQTRRTFLETTTGAMLSGLAMSRAWSAEDAAQSASNNGKKANILVILTDDLGYGDLSCYHAPDLDTPNVDRLAREGMRFTHAYANCPVCSPTRAALLSGRYPDLVGVPGVVRTHAENSWGYLLPGAKLLPAQLQEAGYHTALVGKWHLGLEEPNLPNQRGFEHFHGFLGDMMDDYYNHLRHGNNYMRKNREVIEPEGHATDLFTEWACDYLRARKESDDDAPFFLYLSYNAPHTPIQPPEDWLQNYQEKHPEVSERRAKLASFIEHLDHGIGQVLDTLDECELTEDTLVIFTSDNGGQSGVGANNGPLRAGKGTMYEGGIRVPLIVRYPGKTPTGSMSDRIVMSMDLLPTAMEAAGVPVATEHEGVSHWTAWQGKPQVEAERDLFFTRREGGRFEGGRIEALRRGDWKLLQPMPDQPYELYNLRIDPHERTEVGDAYIDIFDELKTAMEYQLARYDEVPWQPPERR